MNIRELINNLLKALADDEAMAKIMLLAQAVSFELNNEQFSKWVRNEQRGYEDEREIPDYRSVHCILKVDIFVPYQGIISNFTIPTDLIKDKKQREFLSATKLPQSLAELELYVSKESDNKLSLGVPGIIIPSIDKLLNKGNVQRAYREISPSVPQNIINIVKAKLLDFFSFLSRRVDLDTDLKSERNQNIIDSLFDKYIWK